MTPMKAAATATVNTISILLIECDPDPQRRLSPSSDSGDGNAVELASGLRIRIYQLSRSSYRHGCLHLMGTQSMICWVTLERNPRGCGLRGKPLLFGRIFAEAVGP